MSTTKLIIGTVLGAASGALYKHYDAKSHKTLVSSDEISNGAFNGAVIGLFASKCPTILAGAIATTTAGLYLAKNEERKTLRK